jgi:hypothetical protein
LPGWPRFERLLRILLLSDFHIGCTPTMSRAIRPSPRRRGVLPDLVPLGGDYVNMQIACGVAPPRAIARCWRGSWGGTAARHPR